jgi:hypothetical protein
MRSPTCDKTRGHEHHGRLVKDFEKALHYHEAASELPREAKSPETKGTERRGSTSRSTPSGRSDSRAEERDVANTGAAEGSDLVSQVSK